MSREALVAVVMAGLGIVAGNTLLDFTNDLDGRLFSSQSVPPTLQCVVVPSPGGTSP